MIYLGNARDRCTRTRSRRIWAAMLVGCATLPFAGSAQRLPSTPLTPVQPGSQWRDNRGRLIEAHGGGMTLYRGTYYWFGEDRSPDNRPGMRYVACYASKDLVHWTFCGQVLKLADPEHLGPHWVLERPKVFVDAHTGRFVMYAHIDDAHYKYARVMVAVSHRIAGPYCYVKSFRPFGQESRDIGQFVDDDGAAYLIFESRPTKGFFIAKLIDNDLNVEKTAFLLAPLEGGSLVRYQGLYYVVGSHMTGWKPNPNVYAVAPSLAGPWTHFKDIAPPQVDTYGSQSTMLFKVVGSRKTAVIFMGDIWKPKALWDSRYLWMPLVVGKGHLRLPSPQPWTIDVKTGVTTLMDRVSARTAAAPCRAGQGCLQGIAVGGVPQEADRDENGWALECRLWSGRVFGHADDSISAMRYCVAGCRRASPRAHGGRTWMQCENSAASAPLSRFCAARTEVPHQNMLNARIGNQGALRP
ncbi:MAG: family 43 glycosylhydrolase [Acidobacteriota bacterium]